MNAWTLLSQTSGECSSSGRILLERLCTMVNANVQLDPQQMETLESTIHSMEHNAVTWTFKDLYAVAAWINSCGE